MAVDENSGGTITLEEARKFMADFAVKFPNQIKSQFIGSANVRRIIDQDPCVGLQVYYGYDKKENRLNMFMLGIDGEGNAMTDVIMDRMMPCPPMCPPTGP